MEKYSHGMMVYQEGQGWTREREREGGGGGGERESLLDRQGEEGRKREIERESVR